MENYEFDPETWQSSYDRDMYNNIWGHFTIPADCCENIYNFYGNKKTELNAYVVYCDHRASIPIDWIVIEGAGKNVAMLENGKRKLKAFQDIYIYPFYVGYGNDEKAFWVEIDHNIQVVLFEEEFIPSRDMGTALIQGSTLHVSKDYNRLSKALSEFVDANTAIFTRFKNLKKYTQLQSNNKLGKNGLGGTMVQGKDII